MEDLNKLSTKDIAARIDAHLKRWEADPVINIGLGTRGTQKYWNAGAWLSGGWVKLHYVSYQHTSSLRRTDALKYLQAIEGGFVGSHYRITQPV